MRLRVIIIFIFACVAVYMCNGRPHAEIDCVPAPYTAWSMVRHGSLDLRYYPDVAHLVGSSVLLRSDGEWVSMRPVGAALAAIPFVAPLALFREQPPSANTMLQLGKLAAAFSVACAAALFFLVCKRFAPRAAWPATLLFAFGTCLYSVAAQALWMHGPAVFWLCAGLYLLTKDEAGKYDTALAGLSLGFAVLTRPTTAFFAFAAWLTLLLLRRWRKLGELMLGGLIPLILLCGLNWIQFGAPVKGGYANDAWGISPPFWVGFFGLLIAPSRGVLVYSPALLLLPLGMWQLRRGAWEEKRNESRVLLLTWLAACAVSLLFFARWWDWSGEYCYGPRFLCETMPALCLVFALGYEKLQSRWSRGGAGVLIALSILVHVAGVFGMKGSSEWHARHNRPDQGRCLFEIHDTQIGQQLSSLLWELGWKTGPKP